MVFFLFRETCGIHKFVVSQKTQQDANTCNIFLGDGVCACVCHVYEQVRDGFMCVVTWGAEGWGCWMFCLCASTHAVVRPRKEQRKRISFPSIEKVLQNYWQTNSFIESAIGHTALLYAHKTTLKIQTHKHICTFKHCINNTSPFHYLAIIPIYDTNLNKTQYPHKEHRNTKKNIPTLTLYVIV